MQQLVFRPHLVLGLAACVAIAAAVALGQAALLAQPTPPPDSAVLVRTEAAGRTVTVSVQPLAPGVGTSHFVAVFEPHSPGDVDEVWLFGRPPSGGQKETVRALDEPGAPGRYVANFEFSQAGDWEMELWFSSRGSTVSAPFDVVPFKVTVTGLTRSAGRAPLSSVVWALVTLAITGGAAWLVWSARRARSKGAGKPV